MAILSASHIYKTYQSGNEQIHVLKDMNFEIQNGEIVAIMGESGCGKTTLLHLLCGIDSADSGEICISGEQLSAMTDEEASSFRKKKLGMIFQDFQLLDSLCVKDNILVPLILNNYDMDDQETAYERVIESLNIAHLATRNLSEISGGQQQKAAIARAFIHQPELIFADEPTGNLDAKATRDVMGKIVEMNHRFGTSVLIVTHDSYIASFCDRVLLLKDGKFVEEIKKKSDYFNDDIASLLYKMGGLVN